MPTFEEGTSKASSGSCSSGSRLSASWLSRTELTLCRLSVEHDVFVSSDVRRRYEALAAEEGPRPFIVLALLQVAEDAELLCALARARSASIAARWNSGAAAASGEDEDDDASMIVMGSC